MWLKNYKKELEEKNDTIASLINSKEQLVLEKDAEIKELKNKCNQADIKLNHKEALMDELINQRNEGRNIIQSSVEEINISIENISSVGEEVTASAEELTATAEEISERVSNAYKLAKDGGEVMKDFTKEINSIADNVTEFSQKIINISSIVETIQNIADQTNLLSLNASIESAKAGEQGKGFAVIASEIRKLSEQSKESSKEINNIVKILQLGMSTIFEQINSSNAQCKQLLDDDIKRIDNIEIIDDSIKNMAQTTINVAKAVEEQTTSTLEISQKCEQLNKFVKEKLSEVIEDFEDENAFEENRYEITKEKGKVTIGFYGFLTEESMQQYIVDYGKLKKEINIKNTILILDTRKLALFPKEAEDSLGEFYKDYTNFKKVYMIIGDNKALKAQFIRVWRKINILDKFHFIDNVNEI